VRIRSAVHEILADEAFTATDGLISQSFVVALVPPAYVQIALIWGFLVQLGLGKSVYWLWRYKLNEVCDTLPVLYSGIHSHVPVVVIDSHCQSIHILEPGGFFLFLGRDRILDLIGEFLVIVIAQHTIPLT